MNTYHIVQRHYWGGAVIAGLLAFLWLILGEKILFETNLFLNTFNIHKLWYMDFGIPLLIGAGFFIYKRRNGNSDKLWNRFWKHKNIPLILILVIYFLFAPVYYLKKFNYDKVFYAGVYAFPIFEEYAFRMILPYFFLKIGEWIRHQIGSNIQYTDFFPGISHFFLVFFLGISHFFSAFFFVTYHRYNNMNGLHDLLKVTKYVEYTFTFAILASLLFILIVTNFDTPTAYVGVVIHHAFRNFNSGISWNWLPLQLIRENQTETNILGIIILLGLLLLPKYHRQIKR